MTHIKHVGVVAIALAAGTLTSVAQPAAPNFVEIANRIVGTSANVKEGEIVELVGSPADMPLLEELSIACTQRGAFPFIKVDSESLTKKWIIQSLPKNDSVTDGAALALAKTVNVIISLPTVRDDSTYSGFPGARIAKLTKAAQPISETLLKRNVRTVSLDNNLAPSPSRAKNLGVAESDLAAMFWAGLAADYSAVQETGKTVKDQVAKASELHITLPNGTDLKMKIKGRKVNVSDGVLTDAEIKAGGSALTMWMPAGEVVVTPVPGTAEGKLVDDRMMFLGKEVLGVTAEFKAGKITAISAKSGWDAVKAVLDASPAESKELSVVDLGINPSIKNGGKLETYMAAGSVSINTGGNTWAGGSIKDAFGLTFQLTTATVTLDGKVLVENGVLK